MVSAASSNRVCLTSEPGREASESLETLGPPSIGRLKNVLKGRGLKAEEDVREDEDVEEEAVETRKMSLWRLRELVVRDVASRLVSSCGRVFFDSPPAELAPGRAPVLLLLPLLEPL